MEDMARTNHRANLWGQHGTKELLHDHISYVMFTQLDSYMKIYCLGIYLYVENQLGKI